MANEEVRIANEAAARRVLVDCMLKYGIANTTKERVARESHLSLTSIVRYFPTKDSMVEAAAQSVGRLNQEYFKMTLEGKEHQKGAELLKEFFNKVTDAYIKYPAPYVLRAEIVNYVYRNSEDSQNAIRIITDEMGYRHMLLKVLERGFEDGSIKIDYDARTETDYIGDLLFNFMSGMAVRCDMSDEAQATMVRERLTYLCNVITERVTAK